MHGESVTLGIEDIYGDGFVYKSVECLPWELDKICNWIEVEENGEIINVSGKKEDITFPSAITSYSIEYRYYCD